MITIFFSSSLQFAEVINYFQARVEFTLRIYGYTTFLVG